MRHRLLLPVLLLAVAAPLHAQRPQTAVLPQSITVGDVFHAAIRIDLPAGTELLAPDTLALDAQLEQAGRREVRYDTADGGRRATIVYPLTAWRAGAYELPAVSLQLVAADGASAVEAVLPRFTVTSVLPQDTSGIEPKGAKDVFGANRVWWPIVLALLVLLAAIALAVWWWRRRRRPAEAPAAAAPHVAPRTAALAALDALRREGLIERGEMRELYIRLTEILRRYAASVHPDLGTDLTTSELTGMLRRQARSIEMLELVRILGAADLVKFAAARPTAAIATADLDAARAWVERIGRVSYEDPERRAA